jgi:predicted CXXCH cytochrome family protein
MTRRAQPDVTTGGTQTSKRTRRFVVTGAAALVAAAGAAIGAAVWMHGLPAREGLRPAEAPGAAYVGGAACSTCHKAEADKWTGSDHALAMQTVNEKTVLGDFDDARFTYAGVTSTFYKRDQQFFVRTDGPDGTLQDYRIEYVFGVRPLQQYLIAFPGGKLQALGIAWDSRPKTEGGQRWFHLYPEQNITHTDPLHWTGRNQNWNFMCAACHSTNLQKNYELASDSYKTTWSEINVSCEACHGPGSKHVAWARAPRTGAAPADDPTKGLLDRAGESAGGAWKMTGTAQNVARWTGATRSSDAVNSCARCHARTRPIASRPEAGRPLLDTHVPALLDDGVYHADGQILDEVFEYGSFTQSKMHQAGVTCTDCHDPHSVKLLRAPGNATCTKCHQPSTFDTAAHHRHTAGTEAALCVSCHMPKKNYMVVDPRRDHSFRVPRPDLTIAFGTPNACAQCHQKQSPQWALDAMARWYGPNRRSEPHYTAALDAGRRGLAIAEQSLAAVAGNRQQPAIVRATALSLLVDHLSPSSLPAVSGAVADSDPLVRAAAARALEPVPAAERVRLSAGLLVDPVRAVRIEAARVLAGTPAELLLSSQRDSLGRAIDELIAAEMASAERPESHLSLGLLYIRLGRLGEAEASLRTALRLDPRFVPAMVNLADLYRAQNRDDAGETILRQAVSVAPANAEATHSLGLLLVRRGQSPEALERLRQADALRPDVPRYGYAYALALQAKGEAAGAVAALEQTHLRHPADRTVLVGLVAMERARGNATAAIRYVQKLLELSPTDLEAQAMLEELRR